MEYRTGYQTNRTDEQQFEDLSVADAAILERLESLIAENERHELALAGGEPADDEFEAALMKRPVSTKHALSYFGVAIGSIIPASILGLMLANANPSNAFVFTVLSVLAVVTTSATGFFTGRKVGEIVHRIEQFNVFGMFGLAILTGLVWGIVSGGFGGMFLFGIGLFPGAILGGIAGGVLLPFFTLFHRGLKKGDMIELSHLLPIILGLTLIVSASILGAS